MAKKCHRRKGDNNMALTRSFLKGMQLTSEQENAIIEAHSETVNGLKAEAEKEKERADENAKKLKTLEDQGGDWQKKYEKEHEDFEAYKKDQEAAASRGEVEKAYRALAKEAGVSEKRIDTVIKCDADKIAKMKLDKDGKLKDADTIKEDIKKDWSDFITSTNTSGANTPTPPNNEGGKKAMSKDEILAIKDVTERQKAIAENPEAFGIQ